MPKQSIYTEEERHERKLASQRKYRKKLKDNKTTNQDTDRYKQIQHDWYIRKKAQETPQQREARLTYQREYRNKNKNKKKVIITNTETRKRYDPDEECPIGRKEASKWRKRRDYHIKKMIQNANKNIERADNTIEYNNNILFDIEYFGEYSIANAEPHLIVDTDGLFTC